jgi:high-affinity Fe2+/Pb2+ permease
MFSTVLSTALVLVREGFESVLLTGMIAAALPPTLKYHVTINFLVTWVLTLLAGWFAVESIWPYMENIEHVMMLITAAVLIYIFFNSKAIFEHAQEHAQYVKDSNIWVVHLTIFLICLREALESTVFLGSNIKFDPEGVIQGLGVGVLFLAAVLMAFRMIGRRIVNKIMFKYVGFSLLGVAGYYIYHGVTELIEQNGIDWIPFI